MPSRRVIYMPSYYSATHHRELVIHARHHGWTLIAIRPFERNPACIAALSIPVDGIVTDGISGRSSIPLRDFAAAVDVPVVSLTDTTLSCPEVSCVVADPRKVARLALNYFLGAGVHRYVVWVHDLANPAEETPRAFQGLAARSHLKVRFFEKSTLPNREQQIPELLNRHIRNALRGIPRPVGFFCSHDKNAAEVVRACHATGIPVPESVCVVGVGNDPIHLAALEREVASIDPNEREVARKACVMLDAMIDGELAPGVRRLIRPGNVVIHSPPTPLGEDEQRLCDALEFIRIHLCDGVRVQDLCFELGLSRSTVHGLFARLRGTSPGHEIKRMQIEKAKELLSNPHLRIETVARACGFGSNKSLAKAFNREVGMSPGEYREGCAGTEEAAAN